MKGNKKTHFVKGQKLIRVDYDGLAKEKIGEIHTFNGYSSRGLALIDEGKGYKDTYYSERYETIIQSLDDCVDGMELTVKKDLNFIDRKGFITKGREKTTKIIVSHLSKYHDNSVVCVEREFWWPIECFEEYQPFDSCSSILHINGIRDNSITNLRYVDPSDNKRYERGVKKMEIKVVKNFTILDIYKKNPCKDEYEALLKENNLMDNYSVGFYVYADDSDIKASKVLMRNIPWLIQEGFIKEVEKDVVLKRGMRVKNQTAEFIIIPDYKMVDLGDGESYSRPNTLSKLIKDKGCFYEVISE